VTEGHSLWSGYRPFENTPSMKDPAPAEPPQHKTLFEDAVYWSSKMKTSKEDLDLLRQEPKRIAIPVIRLVLADWRTVLKYMTTMLGKIEWEFENPHWGERPSEIDTSLKKIVPWKRNIHYYKAMVGEAIERLFPPEVRNRFVDVSSTSNSGLSSVSDPNAASKSKTGLLPLLPDFRIVQNLMDASQQRIEVIQTSASNSINIEESRRAVKQNKNLARLTFLATIFIPLNFTSSFLSMSPNFAGFKNNYKTIWIFFAIGVPLTLLALLVVDLTHPEKNGKIMRKLDAWGVITKRKEDATAPSLATSGSINARPKLRPGKTIPWTSGVANM
jgi:hypothetical protein